MNTAGTINRQAALLKIAAQANEAPEITKAHTKGSVIGAYNKAKNELEEAGMLKRARWLGDICATPLGLSFLKSIEEIQKDVVKEVENLV